VDDDAVERYLERIGASRPAEPTADALADLHARHLLAVPFENLSIHLGERMALDEESLLDKLVTRRRGGFCYELNGAFGLLLEALGFPVAYLGAGVFGEWGRLSHLFDHMVLGVEAGGPWLADVGFGNHSLYPLRRNDPGPQADPHGTFEIAPTPAGDLDVLRDGTPQYRVETRARRLRDFGPTCWWQQTSPDSHFTRSLVCTLPLDRDGNRVTLSGRRLIRTLSGERREWVFDADDEVLDAYRDLFGIRLDRVPDDPATHAPTAQPDEASTNPNLQAK
jgi:N-hydroxyarylamine O-acetyltransferase